MGHRAVSIITLGLALELWNALFPEFIHLLKLYYCPPPKKSGTTSSFFLIILNGEWPLKKLFLIYFQDLIPITLNELHFYAKIDSSTDPDFEGMRKIAPKYYGSRMIGETGNEYNKYAL